MYVSDHVHGLRDAGLTDDGRWYRFLTSSERPHTSSESSGTDGREFRLPGYRVPILPIPAGYRTGQIYTLRISKIIN